MMTEIRRVLHLGEGRLLLIDFEKPWNTVSRLGRIFTYSIERMAGGEHFRNGQRFLNAGGLRAFLARHGWQELESRPAPWGNSRIVVARHPGQTRHCQNSV